jgi:putative FmdB family regulatory protein
MGPLAQSGNLKVASQVIQGLLDKSALVPAKEAQTELWKASKRVPMRSAIMCQSIVIFNLLESGLLEEGPETLLKAVFNSFLSHLTDTLPDLKPKNISATEYLRLRYSACLGALQDKMTYEYECKTCHFAWEEDQKITEEPLTICPNCGEDSAMRLISAGGKFILKGGGWYADLYSSTK